MLGSLLVAIQLSLIAVLAWRAGAVLESGWFSAGVIVSGLWMMWAVWSMPRKALKIHPSPAEAGSLCRERAYHRVRHPMYGAVLLGTLMLAWADGEWLSLTCWLSLIPVLWLKSRLEEKLLGQRYPEYEEYRRITPCWIPFWPMGNSYGWLRWGRCLGWSLLVLLLATLGWQVYEGAWDAKLFDGETARNIRAEEAALLIESTPDMLILDVRSEQEFSGKRLPEAVNISISDPGFDEKLRTAIAGKTSILIYCAGGYRSRHAVGRIHENGISMPLYHLHRGMLEWWWR